MLKLFILDSIIFFWFLVLFSEQFWLFNGQKKKKIIFENESAMIPKRQCWQSCTVSGWFGSIQHLKHCLLKHVLFVTSGTLPRDGISLHGTLGISLPGTVGSAEEMQLPRCSGTPLSASIPWTSALLSKIQYSISRCFNS